MTKVIAQKFSVPDQAQSPLKAEAARLDLWQAMTMSGATAQPAQQPDVREPSTPVMEPIETAGPGNPAGAAAASPPRAPAPVQLPALPPAAAGYIAEVSTTTPLPAVAQLRLDPTQDQKIVLTDATGHGFAYPQNLIAQTYLSQLQADGHIEALPGNDIAPHHHAKAQAKPGQMPVMTRGAEEPMPAMQAATAEGAGSAYPWGDDLSADETTPATAMEAPHLQHDQVEWLRRNFLMANREGQLHVWLRDYHLDEKGEAALIEQIVHAARTRGDRIKSITLNGRVVWQDGNP